VTLMTSSNASSISTCSAGDSSHRNTEYWSGSP
jgi:hypothetical protein